MSEAEILAYQAELDPCLPDELDCAVSFAALTPNLFVETASNWVSYMDFVCEAQEAWAREDYNKATSAFGGALLMAVDLIAGALVGPGTVLDLVISVGVASKECAEVVGNLAEGKRGEGELDSLAAGVKAVFDSIGSEYSNQVFVEGPGHIRIASGGGATTIDSLGHAESLVFRFDARETEWGRVGPNPYVLGDTTANEHAALDVEFHADSAGTLSVVVLHKTAVGDSVLWLGYTSVEVNSLSALRLAVADTLEYPYGFGLEVDFDGDGLVDEVRYPNGESVVTAVGATEASGVPCGLRVVSRPNPFNPITEIQYSVPADGRVHLAIYDVAGALVATLVDARVSAGDHVAVWSGRDVAGADAPSGLYFARLRAGEYVAVRKMVLLK